MTLTTQRDFKGALSADREAATIYVALHSLDPERYRDSLEQAAASVRSDLRDLGRSEKAISKELDRLLSAEHD